MILLKSAWTEREVSHKSAQNRSATTESEPARDCGPGAALPALLQSTGQDHHSGHHHHPLANQQQQQAPQLLEIFGEFSAEILSKPAARCCQPDDSLDMFGLLNCI